MSSIGLRQSGLLTAALNNADNRTSRLNTQDTTRTARLNNRATNTRIQQQDAYTNGKTVVDDLDARIEKLMGAYALMVGGPGGGGENADSLKQFIYGLEAERFQTAKAVGIPASPRHKELTARFNSAATGEQQATHDGQIAAAQTAAQAQAELNAGVPQLNAQAKNAELAATDHAALGAAEGEKSLANKRVVFDGTAQLLGLQEGTPEHTEFKQQFAGYKPKEYAFNAYTIAAVQTGVAKKLEAGIALTTDEFTAFKTTAESLGGAEFFALFAKEMASLSGGQGGKAKQPVDDIVVTPELASSLGINPMTGATFTVDEINKVAKEMNMSVADTVARIKEKVK